MIIVFPVWNFLTRKISTVRNDYSMQSKNASDLPLYTFLHDSNFFKLGLIAYSRVSHMKELTKIHRRIGVQYSNS